ncbi:hypothetical protein ASZ90_015890 [hydrocarbon metagenome]|uniref:Uncharacterized protein n=1 Tax=hydrocarbon metagenome TaxID=938273 RepID=A0A0W8F0Z4_9ZZZZ
MSTVIYEGEDFKRMLRTDLARIEKMVAAKKFGIFEVPFRDKKIKVEIAKKGDSIIVRRHRAV